MTISLKHAFTSNVSDSGDANLVQPSNWNAEHTLTAAANTIIGAVTAGAVTEITCTAAGRAILDDADASAQRTTLGLGTIATQNSNNVTVTGGSITGITDLAVADGGTGASDASGARTNLGIGTIGTQNSNNVSITGGSITGITDLAVSDGGTGVSTITGIIKGNGTSAFSAATAGTDYMVPTTTSNVSIGFTVTPYSLGTANSGANITLNGANGNYQYVTNNSSGSNMTFTAPSSDCAIDVLVINGASGAGNVLFSGFKTAGSGASGSTFATTANTWWTLSVRRINTISTYVWSGPWT